MILVRIGYKMKGRHALALRVNGAAFLCSKFEFSAQGERKIQNLRKSPDVGIIHLGLILGNELKKRL
jgi:hypothetical protein